MAPRPDVGSVFRAVSGRLSGVGGREAAKLRGCKASGEDCAELLVRGLAADVGPWEADAVAGVTVNGTAVLIYGLGKHFVEGVGEGQPAFPYACGLGNGDVAAGAMTGGDVSMSGWLGCNVSLERSAEGNRVTRLPSAIMMKARYVFFFFKQADDGDASKRQ